jgi:hypothetical protein
MCHTDMVACDKVYDVPPPIVLGTKAQGSSSGSARAFAP